MGWEAWLPREMAEFRSLQAKTLELLKMLVHISARMETMSVVPGTRGGSAFTGGEGMEVAGAPPSKTLVQETTTPLIVATTIEPTWRFPFFLYA